MRRLIYFALACSLLAGCTHTRRVAIITGQDYPGHKWRQTAPLIHHALAQDPRLHVTTIADPNVLATKQIFRYDTLVLHFANWRQPDPGPRARANLQRFVTRGNGLVVIHYACGAFADWPEYPNLVGRVWGPDSAHDPYRTFPVHITDPNHPITQGLADFDTTDELYYNLAGRRPIHVLATAHSLQTNSDHPIAFTFRYFRGRVFHCPLGHDAPAFKNPHTAQLLRQAALWTARLPTQP